MTARFTTRSGQRIDRQARLASTHWQSRGSNQPPSVRAGVRWAALPVEGSKAWRDRQPLLSRIFSR